jgi:hypothetical protein
MVELKSPAVERKSAASPFQAAAAVRSGAEPGPEYILAELISGGSMPKSIIAVIAEHLPHAVEIALAASVAAYEWALAPSMFTNSSWIAAACALTAWYKCACDANCVAVKTDTASAAAGVTPVVGAAEAAVCATRAEPIPCSWLVVAAKISGCVVTNDIGRLLKEAG